MCDGALPWTSSKHFKHQTSNEVEANTRYVAKACVWDARVVDDLCEETKEVMVTTRSEHVPVANVRSMRMHVLVHPSSFG